MIYRFEKEIYNNTFWVEYDDVTSSYIEMGIPIWIKTKLPLDEFTVDMRARGYVRITAVPGTPALNTPTMMVPKAIHRWELGNAWYEYNEYTLEESSSTDPTWTPAHVTLAQARSIMASSGFVGVSPYTPYTKLGATGPAAPAPSPSPQSIIKVLYEDNPDSMSGLYYKPTEKSLQSNTCNHEWVCYTGLNESYEFCKLCDLKRGLK